ncbi:MAG: LacI family DNA-binding transcriptional regulator [Hespellia sp.]|nr:LacI family DNA-binding transcriptional regulator [Hespellia sp.]
MATIKDVAKAAGVSTATVSRVIHNDSSVKPATYKSVLDVINKLNYTPNVLARQLRTQKTKTVIVIVPNIRNTFFSDIIFGIENCARKHNYQILIADMHGQPDIEDYYYQAIQERMIDGIISLSANVAKSLIEQISDQYPVVVACQYLENYNIPNVTIDNNKAATAMTEYLMKLNHNDIVFISGPVEMTLYRDRMNGFLSATASAGIPLDLEYVRYGDASVQSGYVQMKEFLDSRKPFSAVFAAGDMMAIGALRALQEAGLEIPKDCSVAGFDDIELSQFVDPPLTTVHQPCYQIGETAFKKLLKLMNKQQIEAFHNVLDFSIVTRDSSAKKGE